MANIVIRSDITQLPLLDTELFYINPPYLLNPGNYEAIAKSIDNRTLHQIRFGYYVSLGCCYPRFDLENHFYNLKTNPILNMLPDKNLVHVDFDVVTNNRAIQLERHAEKYEKVYLFWSGGIDSTVMLYALLNNWSSHSLSKLIVVLNKNSIDEYPNLYNAVIKNKLNVASMDDFFAGSIQLTNDALYMTGDIGDEIMGYGHIYEFDAKYPGVYKQPWRNNVDTLIEYFSANAGSESGTFAFEHVVESLTRADIEMDSVYDFLSWLDFNWGYDFSMYYLLWIFSMFPDTVNPQRFMEENMIIFFNNKEYQNWTISTIGTNLKIGDTVNTHKLSAKKYIYEFDKDADYFIHKLKEQSTPKNNQLYLNKRLVAIDTRYNLYYMEPSIWLNN